MEKGTPHYKLDRAKALILEKNFRFTVSATMSVATMGFDLQEALEVILALDRKSFYKSMTTFADSKIWQDVYRPSTDRGDVYLKLTVENECLIVSFKER